MAPRMRGLEEHRARLRRMRGPAMINAVTQSLFVTAQDLANDAALSITEGATSGAGHIASKPGEPPNADTHVLDRSVVAAITGPLKAETSADAPYAARLEKGDSTVEARPFMKPAAVRIRPVAQKRFLDAVNHILNRRGK